MSHERFSMTDDWELEDPSRDVRGRTVVDGSGSPIGTVTDMLVDPTTESIDAVVLDTGQEVSMIALEVEDDRVRLLEDAWSPDAMAGNTGTSVLDDTAGLGGDQRVDGDTSWMDDTSGRATDTATSQRDGTRVRLREEELQARTRPQQAGEVVVQKDVVEEPRTIDVPVTREEVVVERRPVTDGTIDAGQVADEGDTIRVPVMAESVEVTKQPRVVEEVEISKRAVTEQQRVSDTVRREQVDVRDEGDVDVIHGRPSQSETSRSR